MAYRREEAESAEFSSASSWDVCGGGGVSGGCRRDRRRREQPRGRRTWTTTSTLFLMCPLLLLVLPGRRLPGAWAAFVSLEPRRTFFASTTTTTGARSKMVRRLPTSQHRMSATDFADTAASSSATSVASSYFSSSSSSSSSSLLPTRTRRVLSGVQPTGTLHLGNYLGAIRQWVDFQDNPAALLGEEESDGEEGERGNEAGGIQRGKVENFFCVVDLHAITMPHDPSQLSESTLASAALYLAAGIDPAKSNIFVQSHVTAHAELTWLLNCMTPMNWLERMIQYKDKAKKQQQAGGEGGEDGGSVGGGGAAFVGVGLFDYPVLMAADILLYQATHVPVGEDQRQHLELARDICRRFHDLFCKGNAYKKRCKAAGIPSKPVFVEPNAMIVKEGGARIMSLTDGTSKMSKSDNNDASRINVLDPPDVIRAKIKRCKTDATVGLEWDNPSRPEATNLLNIYAAVQPERSRDSILEEVKDLTWGEFKPRLADAIVSHLEPIQERYKHVRADDAYLRRVLADGARAADAVASQTLRAAKVAMGFVESAPATVPVSPPTSQK